MRVIQENGVVYYPDLGVFFFDPAYWQDYYRKTGVLPKPPSAWDKLKDTLFNVGAEKFGDWLFGGSSSFGLGSLFDKITSLPKMFLGEGSFLDKLFELPKTIFSTGSSASNFAQALEALPTEVLQGIVGDFNIADKTELVSQILGKAPQSTASSSSLSGLGGFLDDLSGPLAAVGSFLDAYQKGKPSALGLGGTALLGFSNPATLPFAVAGMALGSFFGRRRRRKAKRREASKIAQQLSPTLGLDSSRDFDSLVYRNLDFFKQPNLNIEDLKSAFSDVDPKSKMGLLALETKIRGADKMKEFLLPLKKRLQTIGKFANPDIAPINTVLNPFAYNYADILDALSSYSGSNPYLNELKKLLG